MRQIILYISHQPPLAGHPKQRGMYDTIRKDFYWPKILQGLYHTVSDYKSFAKNEAFWKQEQHLQLFLATEPFQFSATDILGPLSELHKRNQYIFFINES